MKVPLRLLDHGHAPRYATQGSAGADLMAAVDVTLLPGAYGSVPTGVTLALPPGYEAQVRPRSGLALRHGITVLNAPGTIDEDYRGEIKVLLINHGKDSFQVVCGMRVAQLVIAPYVQVTWEPHASLPRTERHEGGFGSTGL